MNDPQLERIYGFGARRVLLSPVPLRLTADPPGLIRALRSAWGESHGESGASALRSAPGLVLVVMLFIAMVVTLGRDRTDDAAIELVAFEAPKIVAPVPEVLPVEAVLRLEPAPVPEPEPAPVRIAEVESVLPRPPAIEVPKPIVTAPSVPRIEASPTLRIARRRPERSRPQIQIDALARRVPPSAPVAQLRRATRVDPRRSVTATPIVEIGALAASVPTPQAQPVARLAFRPVRPVLSRGGPGVAVAPVAMVASAEGKRPSQGRIGANRAARVFLPGRTTRRSQTRPEIELASAMGGVLAAPAPASSGVARRSERMAAATDFEDPQRSQASGLAGVPLAALAACLSDREEDLLKQRVVAAARHARVQGQCVSAAGHYRFVQVKNVNAFLMYVQSSNQDHHGDRCVELGNALDCLRRDLGEKVQGG